MDTVKLSNEIMALINYHMQHSELDDAQTSMRTTRAFLFKKTEFFSEIESLFNQVLNKKVTRIISFIEYTLQKQKKTDYSMKEGILGNTVFTPTCQAICEHLRGVSKESQDFMEDSNRENFLVEIGTALCRILLDHIKKFTFTYSGGLILATYSKFT